MTFLSTQVLARLKGTAAILVAIPMVFLDDFAIFSFLAHVTSVRAGMATRKSCTATDFTAKVVVLNADVAWDINLMPTPRDDASNLVQADNLGRISSLPTRQDVSHVPARQDEVEIV